MANLKRFILGTSHVYIQEYLNEFCYRFNCRFLVPVLLHEFFHTTATGTKMFDDFITDLKHPDPEKRISDPGYWFRPHEVKARQFTKDVLNANKRLCL